MNCEIKPCNRDLLNFFNLKGNPVPIETGMLICPGIKENCCSLADEINIFSLWNNFTIPKMDRHIEDMLILYNKILAKHRGILDLDQSKIDITHVINKVVQYPLKICERSLAAFLTPPEQRQLEADTYKIHSDHHMPERILSMMDDDSGSMDFGSGGSSFGGSGSMDFGSGGSSFSSSGSDAFGSGSDAFSSSGSNSMTDYQMNLKSDFAKNLKDHKSDILEKAKGQSLEEMQAKLALMTAGGGSMSDLDMSSFSSPSPSMPRETSMDSFGSSGSSMPSMSGMGMSMNMDNPDESDMKSMMGQIDPRVNTTFDLNSTTGDATVDKINQDVMSHLKDPEGMGQLDEDRISSPTSSEDMSMMGSGYPINDNSNSLTNNIMAANNNIMMSNNLMGLDDTMNSNMIGNVDPETPQFSGKVEIDPEVRKKVEEELAAITRKTGIDNTLRLASRKLHNKINLDSGKSNNNKINPSQKFNMEDSQNTKIAKKIKNTLSNEQRAESEMQNLPKKVLKKKHKKAHKKKDHRKLTIGNAADDDAWKDKLYERRMNVELRHKPRHIKCQVTKRKIEKSFKISNKKKKKFCDAVYGKLTKYPIKDFRDYLENMKPAMTKMIGMKKTFYCSLCDQPKQENINTVARTITFTQGFCKVLVTEFKDYINLHNVIFVKYFDALLQYIRCFSTLASESVFPKRSLLKEKMQKVKYIERCFEHANDPDFMDYCFYVCDQYSYTSLSTFFDGDIDFLKKIHYFILSFTRKFSKGEPMTQPMLPEVTDFSRIDFDDEQYLTEGEKEELIIPDDDGMEEKKDDNSEDIEPNKYFYKHETDVDQDDVEEIYEGKKTSMIFDRFVPKFKNDHKALNPAMMDPLVDFNIDIKDLIQLQCKNKDGEEDDQSEGLNRNVIQEFFSISKDDLDSFKNDLFLPMVDYNYFQIEKAKEDAIMLEVGAKPTEDPQIKEKRAVEEYLEIKSSLGEVDGLTNDLPPIK